jgi:hypothetical protein
MPHRKKKQTELYIKMLKGKTVMKLLKKENLRNNTQKQQTYN